MNILFENVSKKYGKKTAVSSFNAEFCRGEVTALLGPSGCGKTTLLNMIAGIVKPTEGIIRFDGVEVNEAVAENYNIGYVFQNYSLYPNMTVYDNISFPLVNIKDKTVSKKERKQYIKQKVQEVAELLKIEDLLKRYPSQLSGGQQQRVAIGRALAKNPDILLMDEPFANLDKKLAVELRDEIRNIQKKLGITLVFVTHNQNDAAMISDKVILLNNGVVQQIGKTDELYNSPCNRFVAEFIGEMGINIINRGDFSCDPAFDGIIVDSNIAGTIAFRPEHINITDCPDEGGECFFVDNIANNGYYSTVILKSRKGTCIKAISERSLKLNQKVLIDINKIYLFDGNGAPVQL